MKAWRVHEFGEPETMRLEDVPKPEPGPGQALIKVAAAGLNFFDILQVQGKYQVKPPFPFIPGAEVAGVVDGTGEKVLAMVSGGGFGEYVAADVKRTAPLPQGMDFATAAAVPVVYQTSYFALKDRAALRAGEWLLVHAAASGVGVTAVQLGRAWGARVIATAGSQEKLDFAMSVGAEYALNYNDGTWVDAVKQITGGRGADVIYDPVGGDVFDLSTKCIASGGRLLVIGFASGRIPTIAANRILLKNMSVVGAVWGGYVQANPGYAGATQRALGEMFESGQLRPPSPVSYPLAEAPKALRDLANRKVLWKAVLTP
ncbi:MAG TPA: NADPH:quinone oxidoreductase family protein [Bryobacteraceae bacterium]|nr:NADPH:quinone oxidoreductase family protein [Bryobacteraceae bacterium]